MVTTCLITRLHANYSRCLSNCTPSRQIKFKCSLVSLLAQKCYLPGFQKSKTCRENAHHSLTETLKLRFEYSTLLSSMCRERGKDVRTYTDNFVIMTSIINITSNHEAVGNSQPYSPPYICTQDAQQTPSPSQQVWFIIILVYLAKTYFSF